MSGTPSRGWWVLAEAHHGGLLPPPAPPQFSKGGGGKGGAPVDGVDGCWACPNCQNVNFAVRQACNRCQTPHPGLMPQQSKGGKGGAPVSGVDGAWACPHCQNVNFAVRQSCNRCQAPKPSPQAAYGAYPPPGAYAAYPPQVAYAPYPPQGGKGGGGGGGRPVAGVDGCWDCHHCQNVNFAVRSVCNRCQAPRQQITHNLTAAPQYAQAAPQYHQAQQPKGKGGPQAGVDGNWACPECQNVNFAMREACNRCQAAKPEGEAFAEAGFDGDMWACQLCQNMSKNTDLACIVCEYPRTDLNSLAEELDPSLQQMPPRPPAPPQGGYRVVPPQSAPGGKGRPVAGVDGNWECPHCQNVNFAVREACNRCQAPKAAPRGIAQSAGKGGGLVAGVDGNWACAQCHNVNYAVRQVCNRCQAPQGPPAVSPWEQPPQQHLGGGGPGAGGKGAPQAGVNGNWACAVCQNVNFAAREVCNRCQTSKHASMQPMVVQPPAWPAASGYGAVHGKGGGGGGAGGPVAGVDGAWACVNCQNINFAVRQVCNRCQAPQAVSAPQHGGKGGGGPVAGVDGNWGCPSCSNVNFAVRGVCNRCQTPKPAAPQYHQSQGGTQYHQPQQKGGKGGPQAGVDGAWACPGCQNINFAVRQACNRCQAPKPEDAFISDADLIAQLSAPAADEPYAKRGRLS